MNNMFSHYIKFWLEFWLTKETKANLSQQWDDKGHPSIIPMDKLK